MKKGCKPRTYIVAAAAFAFARLLASCGAEAPTRQNEPPDAKTLYRQHCVLCHGADGTLALNGAADLSRSVLSLEERIHQIAMGKNTMPPFGAVLTEEEILSLAQYIETFRK
ncbi:MAG: cytochrome c [Saprospiraceae bacterium]|nr:cytochrome c [Saprospiraceae bacterium]MDW8228440.1 cytochrome c [Saprospiraceae bacterium]